MLYIIHLNNLFFIRSSLSVTCVEVNCRRLALQHQYDGPIMRICFYILQRWWASADCPVLSVTEWGWCSSSAPQSSADHGCYWPRAARGIRSHDTVCIDTASRTNLHLVEQIVFTLILKETLKYRQMKWLYRSFAPLYEITKFIRNRRP
jgi:hypothetical protein